MPYKDRDNKRRLDREAYREIRNAQKQPARKQPSRRKSHDENVAALELSQSKRLERKARYRERRRSSDEFNNDADNNNDEDDNNEVNDSFASLPRGGVTTNQRVATKQTRLPSSRYEHDSSSDDESEDDAIDDAIPATTTTTTAAIVASTAAIVASTAATKPYNTRRGKRRNYIRMANGIPSQLSQPEPPTKRQRRRRRRPTTTTTTTTNNDDDDGTQHDNSNIYKRQPTSRDEMSLVLVPFLWQFPTTNYKLQ
jgi:hypothetical protein